MPASSFRIKSWLILLACITAGTIAYRMRPEPRVMPSAALRRPVLAILIFDNLNQDPDLDFLGNALARETVDKLGQLSAGQFDVIAHHSVMTYRKTRKTLQQIGHELDVDYVIEGGARKEGDRLNLATKFTRVSDQATLWSETFEWPMAEAFQIQNLLIERVLQSLNIKADPVAANEVNLASTQNAAARELYLRGVDQCAVEGDEALGKCIASLEMAITEDSKYPRAHVALAAALLQAGRDSATVEAHVRTALQVTDTLPQAHILLGRLNGDESEFQKGIRQNPSDAAACLEYAAFLLAENRLPEASHQVQRALQLDPSSIEATVMSGRVAIAGRFFDRGIAQLQKAVGMDRNDPEVRYHLGAAHMARNSVNDAIREFQRAVSFGRDKPEYIAALGEAFVRARRYEDARAQLRLLLQLSKKRYVAAELINRLEKQIPSP